MSDLKRKLNILQHLSPAISEKQPRTQTKCGGLLMMTLFPVAGGEAEEEVRHELEHARRGGGCGTFDLDQ